MSDPVSNDRLAPAVLEHFRRPRHAGRLAGSGGACTGVAGTVKSTVQVRFQLRMDQGGTIQDVAWQVYGCPWTIAAASWLAEQVRGRAVTEVDDLTAMSISDALGIVPERRSRAMTVEDAFRAALREFGNSSGNEVSE